MRVLGRTGLFGCALSLATVVVLTVTDLGLGASRSIGRPAGKIGASRIHRPQRVLPPFRPAGIIAAGGDSEPQVIIIQTPPPPSVVVERPEPAAQKIYVAPRWVDGGHGVEILEPGHWVETKPAPKR